MIYTGNHLLYTRPSLRVVDGSLHRPPIERTDISFPHFLLWRFVTNGQSDDDNSLKTWHPLSYVPVFHNIRHNMRGEIYSANVVAPPYGYCWSFYCCLSKKGVCRCSASCAAGVIESISPVSPLSLQEHIHSPTLYPSLTPFYRHPFKNMDGFSFQYSPFSHPSRHLRLQTLQILSGMEHYSAIFQGWYLVQNWMGTLSTPTVLTAFPHPCPLIQVPLGHGSQKNEATKELEIDSEVGLTFGQQISTTSSGASLELQRRSQLRFPWYKYL